MARRDDWPDETVGLHDDAAAAILRDAARATLEGEGYDCRMCRDGGGWELLDGSDLCAHGQQTDRTEALAAALGATEQ